METRLHTPVAFLIVPIFALANAGIPFSSFSSTTAVFNPITLGVIAGLVVGKLVGIVGATWLGWKLGWGTLPKGASFHHIVGVALLGGIGFTMSIFIAELAFAGQAEFLVQAKAGVLLASILAGAAGFMVLRKAPVEDIPHAEDSDASQESLHDQYD
jgi:NhaA family Na+:H+ antiporter